MAKLSLDPDGCYRAFASRLRADMARLLYACLMCKGILNGSGSSGLYTVWPGFPGAGPARSPFTIRILGLAFLGMAGSSLFEAKIKDPGKKKAG